MKLDVCICTHSPRPEVFRQVLAALNQQTLAKNFFHVWVIDNESSPPLSESDLAGLESAELRPALLRESRLGLVFARVKAIQATQAEWVVFVDDDAVLAPDYLAQSVRIAAEHPEFGCFSGKLLLPSTVRPPKWVEPMLPYLGIRDCGEQPISMCANTWGIWEPPGAGAVVRRPLLERYVRRLRDQPVLGRLGRKGRAGLFSSEDSLMMRCAYGLGLSCSYQPSLRLEHHLDPRRFQLRYLVRLLFGLGRSHVILESVLGQPVPPAPWKQAWRLLRRVPLRRAKLCRRAYEWGRFLESRSQRRWEVPTVAKASGEVNEQVGPLEELANP